MYIFCVPTANPARVISSIIRARSGDMVVSFIEVPAGNLMPTDRKDTPNSPPTSLPGALGDSRSVQRASTRTEEIVLNKGITEKNIVIRPDPRLGQPGPLAHKVFVALIKKHSDSGRPVQKEISFTKREIMRMVGRKSWGGSDSEELSRALHEIHYAFVKTRFKDSDARFIEHSFNVFPQIWIERRELASDPIEACTITLADPIVTSLQDE